MRIVGIGGFEVRNATAPRRGGDDRRQPEVPETQSRALIAVESATPNERSHAVTHYPAAPFLAQLIATHMQAPQTRARRRAEPSDAVAVYGAMIAQATRTGRVLRRES